MKTFAAVALVSLTLTLGTQSVAGQNPPAQNPPAPSPPAKAEIIQKILVKVNGEILTQTELVDRQIEALRQKNQRVEKPADLQDEPTLRAMLAEITPDVLVETVDELLLIQRGRELGYKMSDDQFKSAVERIKKENRLDDPGFQKALEQMGMTLPKLREQLERQQIIYWVTSSETGTRGQLTEEELKQYYQAHTSEFMRPATVTLRELFIQVPVEGDKQLVNVGADNDAREKITAIRARAVAGEDYVKLVTEVSESASKANGGLIENVAQSDLNPAIRDALAKLKVGEISEPIRTTNGYHLFKLEQRIGAEAEAFEKVREQIGQKIYEDRMEVETKKLLDKLRAQALIEWKDDTYKVMYEKRVTELKGKTGINP
jgi:peptidyl-prolyl cis-trans isomerase SurA